MQTIKTPHGDVHMHESTHTAFELAHDLMDLAYAADGADANAAFCEALATAIFCTCDREEDIRKFVALAADHILEFALDAHSQRLDAAHLEAAAHGGFRQ